jgi:hypothetical protein
LRRINEEGVLTVIPASMVIVTPAWTLVILVDAEFDMELLAIFRKPGRLYNSKEVVFLIIRVP